MAHEMIDTLGKATRHNMLLKVECACGNVRYCRSADLMMVYGGGATPSASGSTAAAASRTSRSGSL